MNPLRYLFGPAGMAMMGDGRPDNSQADMASLQKMLADTKAANRTPNGRVARGFDQFSPMGPYQTDPVAQAPAPAPYPQAEDPMGAPALYRASPGATPPQPASIPMPQARPAEAPQDMGFFQRNAAMMQDPNNPGSFIDPEAASRAQASQASSASGPDVIQKLLDMFHRKADA